MARAQSRYVCQSCGASVLRWEGQCRTCGEWNSLVETVVRDEPRPRILSGVASAGVAVPVSLAAAGEHGDEARRPVGIGELDRVLGGGLVAGSVVLLGGEPGIGKSTLLLQAAAGIAATGASVLYATGEESTSQVRLRAMRLGLASGAVAESIRVVAETGVGRIVELGRADGLGMLVVDSVQTVASEELDGPPGSVGQVREATQRLMEYAKTEGVPVILVGHVTKDGTLAGPKTLEHLVDVVLNVEGDRTGGLRLLRATKNRYGSTEEVGVFEMGERGLTEVADPARAFLADHDAPAPGSVVAPVLEGSRPILVEVQALVAPTGAPSPRRTASGVDPNRLALLVAVLGRRAGIGLAGHDVYANLAGGLTVSEPGLDLPLALALASSLRDRPVVPGTVAIGEVGLLGELRTVGGLDRRLREASRLGFTRALVPRPRGRAVPAIAGLEVVVVGTLGDAVRAALGDSTTSGGRRP
ncbi:MAG TPA: DNA repair protein RadA [Candidatus Limnocylindrales bacterium]|nr:DNA repair protein RadA [Candidatus Limnocylindrales bacterium]